MGWFKPKVDPIEVANLRAEMVDVRGQLETVEQLRVQLEILARQRDEADSRATQLANRLRETTAGIQMLDRRIDSLDSRLTGVSTELTNQLTELSGEIGAASANGVPPESIDALRNGQVKLANEQARFEIAFREDLATLAEQIRRAR